MRILVVDDNGDDRRVLRYMIERMGHVAIEAENGVEGLRKAREDEPALIISDALMPAMDGFQFLRAVKRDASLRSIPFIFYSSSYRQDQDMRLAMSLGADAYLFKPVEPAELWGRIEGLLEAKKQQGQASVEPLEEDAEYLRRYSAVVATKLEEKVRELENSLEEKTRAEEALRESEGRYRRLLDSVTDYVYTVHIRQGLPIETAHGPGCAAVTGYSREDYAADPGLWHRMVYEPDRPAVTKQAAELLTGIAAAPLEHRIVHRDGSLRWVRHTPVLRYDEQRRLAAYDGVIQDITERKVAEEELRRTNRELRAISECNQTLMHAKEEKILLDEICRIICDVAGYRMAWVGYAERDEAESLRPVAWDGVEDGYLEGAGIAWSGKGRGLELAAIAIHEGRTSYAQDFAIEPMPAPWNEAAARRGYRSGIALPLKDEREVAFGVLAIYSADAGAFTRSELRLLEELAGDLAFGISALRTRRDRELAEEARCESERRLRSLFEDSPISIWEEDFSAVKRRLDDMRSSGAADWAGLLESPERIAELAALVKVLDVNRATLELLEYEDKAELIGDLPKVFCGEAFDTFRAELIALASGHCSFEGESAHCTKSGRRIFVYLRLGILPGYEGSWSRVIVSLVDLSERKKAEQALEESEAKYRGLVEQSSEGILLLDESSTYTDCNRVLERLTGLGERQILGRKFWNLEFQALPEGFRTESDFEDLRRRWRAEIDGSGLDTPTAIFESIFRRPDGSEQIIEQTLFPIKMGRELKIGGVLRDVTEQRAASRSLVASLREKELLLQEVHHRVKNNLQIICSLINLQMGESGESSPGKGAFVDMEARVRSMSLVHELLYQSEDLGLVDFSSYANQLCEHLLAAYGSDDGRISLVVSVRDIWLELDKAIPCGLLINEIVVNALKHAFPDGRTGTITMNMFREAEGSICLSIGDDGVGAARSEIVDRGRGTFGLALVESLTRQLDGSCAIEREQGFQVRVSFPA